MVSVQMGDGTNTISMVTARKTFVTCSVLLNYASFLKQPNFCAIFSTNFHQICEYYLRFTNHDFITFLIFDKLLQ